MPAPSRSSLKLLWQRHRMLSLAFLAAVFLLAFFIIRFLAGVAYWSQHRDEAIQPWMTIGYIARSHQVDPDLVRDAAGIPEGARDRRPLIEIVGGDDARYRAAAEAIAEAIAVSRAGAGKAAKP